MDKFNLEFEDMSAAERIEMVDFENETFCKSIEQECQLNELSQSFNEYRE